MAIVRRRRCGRSRVSVPIMRIRPAEQMTGGFAASDAGVGPIQQIGNTPAEFPVVKPWKDKTARMPGFEISNCQTPPSANVIFNGGAAPFPT
ncbi:MAG: hypothetical protein ACLP4R_24845 [Solirubrobacteraceae bacterium]